MEFEKLRTENVISIVKETVEVIEDFYFAENKSLRAVIEGHMHYSYEHVSQCFKGMFGITLYQYAQRRKYTEIYRTHKEKYELYKDKETVCGVKEYKRKMKAIFGDPLKNLQDKIAINENEDTICNREFSRFAKRKIKDIQKNREPVIAKDNQLKLISKNKIVFNKWDEKYIVHDEVTYILYGKILYATDIVDPLVSNFFKKKMYAIVTSECSVETVLRIIMQMHTGSTIKSQCAYTLALEGWGENGYWKSVNLVSSISCSEDEITEVKLSRSYLRWENDELYLVFEDSQENE